MIMRVTQGLFSYIPDLNDDQIEKQVRYALNHGWAISLEWTDDPHPRNSYWEMWGLPLFDCNDARSVIFELNECRKRHPNCYIKINAFDSTRGTESTAMSYIVHRPAQEPGFWLNRQEVAGRQIQYTIKSYAVEFNPKGERYEKSGI